MNIRTLTATVTLAAALVAPAHAAAPVPPASGGVPGARTAHAAVHVSGKATAHAPRLVRPNPTCTGPGCQLGKAY